MATALPETWHPTAAKLLQHARAIKRIETDDEEAEALRIADAIRSIGQWASDESRDLCSMAEALQYRNLANLRELAKPTPRSGIHERAKEILAELDDRAYRAELADINHRRESERDPFAGLSEYTSPF